MKHAALASLFRALSDPTRLRILHLLHEGELCVGDLVTILQIPQPSASRHLCYLRGAGLVESRREGLWSFYSLAPARTPLHRRLVSFLESCFPEVAGLEEDTSRARRIRASGGCCPRAAGTTAR